MTLEEARICRTSKGNEREIPPEDLTNPFFYKCGLSCTRRTLDRNSSTDRLRVRDPLAHHLHDLKLRVIQPKHSCVKLFLRCTHEFVTLLHTVTDLKRQTLVLSERDLHEGINPVFDLIVLPATWLHILQRVDLFVS